MNIYIKIRQLRQTKGFSQEYMSIQLGISQRTYCRIESGISKIDVEKLLEIAQILDTELTEIVSVSSDGKEALKNIQDCSNCTKQIAHYQKIIDFLMEQNEYLRTLNIKNE